MVTVTLARDWTDPDGVQHQAGSQVDIHESLLDDLVAQGVVATDGGEDDSTEWIRFN